MGVVRELFLGALGQIEGFVDVFSLLGVEIGKIIGRRSKFRANF
jgi:hypothetical protein